DGEGYTLLAAPLQTTYNRIAQRFPPSDPEDLPMSANSDSPTPVFTAGRLVLWLVLALSVSSTGSSGCAAIEARTAIPVCRRPPPLASGGTPMTKRHARLFFGGGTLLFAAIFVGMTIDSHRQFGALTNADAITPEVSAGKD